MRNKISKKRNTQKKKGTKKLRAVKKKTCISFYNTKK